MLFEFIMQNFSGNTRIVLYSKTIVHISPIKHFCSKSSSKNESDKKYDNSYKTISPDY
eukprot:Pgem_evm1s19637